jgi:hypothetical protein
VIRVCNGKRVFKYARGSLALQGHLGNENHFGQTDTLVLLAANVPAPFHFRFKRFGTVDRASEA